MAEALYRATQTITPNDLPRMVLYQRDLPAALRHFLPTRDNILDNETMAQQGFPGSTAERFRAVGLTMLAPRHCEATRSRPFRRTMAATAPPPGSGTAPHRSFPEVFACAREPIRVPVSGSAPASR